MKIVPANAQTQNQTQARTLQRLLQEGFGHDSFRLGQEQVISTLLGGRSALAVFPTGGGKSLCYQLPALLMDGMTLVISPLMALMKDQVESLQRKGIAAARLDSSLSATEAMQVEQEMVKGHFKLLYVAPERLTNERFLKQLASTNIAMMAVDEAHCISEWGHQFRPEYLRLAAVAKELNVHPVLALTATATPIVAAEICRSFDIGKHDHVQTTFRRDNLAYHVTPCAEADKLRVLKQRLLQEQMIPAVVYVTLQQTAEMVATWLAREGVHAKAYHAGLPDAYRAEVQEQFMSGDVDVIVATIAFGMGIDKADVRAVFHYNLPKSLENYQQESGRAGRDGNPSHCEMLACLDDLCQLRNFVFADTPSALALRQLVDYLLRQGDEFEISRYELSVNLDLRPQVLESVLTYLELDEVLKPLGSHFAGYQIHFTDGEERLLNGHPADQRRLLKAWFDQGKRGYRWLTLELDAAELALGTSRQPFLELLKSLEEAGEVTLKPFGLRHRYRRIGSFRAKAAGNEIARITRHLQELFATRETADAKRLQQVVDYARDHACLPRHLLNHFGESMQEDCGKCGSCLEKARLGDFQLEPRTLPQSTPRKISAEQVQQIQQLIAEKHAALRSPRQLARFLCGISSPASTRARLPRHDTFGLLEGYDFETVLAQTESLQS